jgi:hypothetical protein
MSPVFGRRDLIWHREQDATLALCRTGSRAILARIVADTTYPTMWRVKMPSGKLSDMTNLVRAKDAAMSVALAILNREQKAQETASEAPPTAPNDFEALSDLEAVFAGPGARLDMPGRKS